MRKNAIVYLLLLLESVPGKLEGGPHVLERQADGIAAALKEALTDALSEVP